MSGILGYHDLLQVLPERRPLLMLDRAMLAADGRSVTGLKLASMDEAYFQGHFPGAPIMPGVLQVAAMSQAGSLLLCKGAPPPAGKIPWLKSLGRIKFRKPVSPGDLMTVQVRIEAETPDGGLTLYGETLVNGEVTCQGTLEVGLLDTAMFTAAPTEFLPAMRPLTTPPEARKLNVLQVMDIIPHRFPFLFVDHIYAMDFVNLRAIGLKHVTGNEPFMAGLPVAAVPLFLQVEMGAQVGCGLALGMPENAGKLGFFMAIDEAKFYSPLVPGDQLLLETAFIMRARFGKGEAKMYVGDRLVSEATIKFAIVDREAA